MSEAREIVERLRAGDFGPEPTWSHSSSARGGAAWVERLLERFWKIFRSGRLKELFVKYLVCRGDQVLYWRYNGVKVGKYCQINAELRGTEPWLVEIGDRVTVAEGVRFITHDGASRLFRDLLPNSSVFGNRFGTIRIHDNCFIGCCAIILPDVEIGPNSIVAAGSVVTRNVPPETVVGGVPARRICSLEEYIEKYLRRMIPIEARSRHELRHELTWRLWGEIR
jgi:acetyltransferase-like isoleucine patch superfamily enzyme